MPFLSDYHQFSGRHWETGSVRDFYAHRSFTAPHSGGPYSEALLLGISGGIVFGYFTFHYEGYDPQCNILTRNTFDAWDTMLSRLGVVQSVEHTRSADRAVKKLTETLEEGLPAIVWADRWSLPYNGLSPDEGMWGAFPIVVYGYEPEKALVHISDRSQVPLTVTIEELAAARGRIKKDKFRLVTLEPPNPDKLAAAVHLGICDAAKLFNEKPPKGSANNFGATAFQYWARMLQQANQRQSWEKLFPSGLPMFAGLTSAYNFAFLFGKGTAQDAERGMYADFLDEAAIILDKPGLREAAERFRDSAREWQRLPGVLLPDEVEPFGQARQLMWRRHTLFLERGGDGLEERLAIAGRLNNLRDKMDDDFPLTQAQVETHRQKIAEQVLRIHEVEQAAVEALQQTMD